MSILDLFKGSLDVHMHAGPSVVPRELDIIEAVKEAEEAGQRAIVVKDHQVPFVAATELVQKHIVTRKNFQVFSGIALNHHVGGFNLLAVETAMTMGAKVVWMPTVSCENHHAKLSGQGMAYPQLKKEMKTKEEHIQILQKDGGLHPKVKDVIDLVLQGDNLVIGTGHGSAEEVEAIIDYAVSRGARQIVANHPMYMVDASISRMKEWAAKGVFIEVCACISDPVSRFYHVDIDRTCEIIQTVGVDQIIVSSDYGQVDNPRPVQGLMRFAELLMEKGFSAGDIEKMVKDNPRRLLNID